MIDLALAVYENVYDRSDFFVGAGRMVDFVDKLELSDQKYQTNGNVRNENYNGNLLFSMNNFVPFGTDYQ